MKKLLALLLLVSTARADDRAAAERYFRAGSQAYSAQNFSAAAADFDEAYKAMPLPEIAFSAAQAYRRLFRVDAKPEYARRCVELYKIYLDRVKTGGRVGDAADSLGEMEREMERANIKPIAAPTTLVEHTRLGVSITIPGQGETAVREVGDTGVVTSGLRATLDGKPIEPFALVDVDPREHVVGVSAVGYLPAEKKTVAIAGQSQLIELELRPQPATLAIHTEANSAIAIDGRPASASLELAAGKHLLTITHRGREPFGKELVLARGQALALEAPLHQTGRRRAVPYVLGGASILAAAAVATGIVAIVRDSHASSLQRSLAIGNQPASVGDEYDRTVASRDHFVSATWILGGTAVAAAATGLALYFFDEPSAESVHLTPLVGAGTGGAVLTGHF